MNESYGAAPRVFISYTHDSQDHRANIADFTQSLREEGINAQLDQFIENAPPLSWPRWMTDEIELADFVLVVCTETYARRFAGRETPGVGYGARWEGSMISSALYYANGERVKFIPVIVDADGLQFIPSPMNTTNFYEIGKPGHRELEGLLRHLHGQPRISPASIGTAPDFQSKETHKEQANDVEDQFARAAQLADQGDGEKALTELLPMLDSNDRNVGAQAAFWIGNIRIRDEQYSEAINAYRRALELSSNGVLDEAIAENLRITLEIMNSHYGEGGPVEAASQFLQIVQAGDMEEVWKRTEPTLRLVLAQAWIWINKEHPSIMPFDRSELADDLANLRSTHKLRNDFFATQLNELQEYAQGYNEEDWGAAEKPRRFGLDYELVVFVETGGEVVMLEKGMSPPSRTLLMRRRGPSWMVSSFTPDYSVPGWPPTGEPLPNLDLSFRREN